MTGQKDMKSRSEPLRTPNHSEEGGRKLIGSPEHLLRKIWVWFRAVRFVMCRQPQQKSGSKQPWSNWYDHQTEEAMPLAGTGEWKGRKGGGSAASASGCTYHDPKLEKCPFPMHCRERGNRRVGMFKRERGSVGLEQQNQEL